MQKKAKVKAIPANLPDEIVVDVTPLKIGNKLYVGDIKADGFTFMHPDNAVVVAVKMSRTAMKGGAAAMDEEDELEAEEVKDQSPDVPTTEEKSTEA